MRKRGAGLWNEGLTLIRPQRGCCHQWWHWLGMPKPPFPTAQGQGTSWARPGSSTAPVPVPEAGRTSSHSTPMGICTSPAPHPKTWGPDLLGHTAPLLPARPAADGAEGAGGVQPLWVSPALPAPSAAVLGHPKGRGEATRGRTLRLSPAAPCWGGTRSGATRRHQQAEGRKQGRKGLPKRSLKGGTGRKWSTANTASDRPSAE